MGENVSMKPSHRKIMGYVLAVVVVAVLVVIGVIWVVVDHHRASKSQSTEAPSPSGPPSGPASPSGSSGSSATSGTSPTRPPGHNDSPNLLFPELKPMPTPSGGFMMVARHFQGLPALQGASFDTAVPSADPVIPVTAVGGTLANDVTKVELLHTPVVPTTPLASTKLFQMQFRAGNRVIVPTSNDNSLWRPYIVTNSLLPSSHSHYVDGGGWVTVAVLSGSANLGRDPTTASRSTIDELSATTLSFRKPYRIVRLHDGAALATRPVRAVLGSSKAANRHVGFQPASTLFSSAMYFDSADPAARFSTNVFMHPSHVTPSSPCLLRTSPNIGTVPCYASIVGNGAIALLHSSGTMPAITVRIRPWRAPMPLTTTPAPIPTSGQHFMNDFPVVRIPQLTTAAIVPITGGGLKIGPAGVQNQADTFLWKHPVSETYHAWEYKMGGILPSSTSPPSDIPWHTATVHINVAGITPLTTISLESMASLSGTWCTLVSTQDGRALGNIAVGSAVNVGFGTKTEANLHLFQWTMQRVFWDPTPVTQMLPSSQLSPTLGTVFIEFSTGSGRLGLTPVRDTNGLSVNNPTADATIILGFRGVVSP